MSLGQTSSSSFFLSLLLDSFLHAQNKTLATSKKKYILACARPRYLYLFLNEMSLNRYRHRNRVFLSLSKMSEDRVFGYWRYKNDTGQGVKPANSSLTFIGIGEFSQQFCVYSIERRFFNHIIAREKQKYKMVYVKLTRA